MPIFRSLGRIVALLGCVAAASTALATGVAAAAPAATINQLTVADLAHLRAAPRVPAARAANAAAVARADERERGLPTFSGSFTTGGQTFPYTMLGADPATGRTTRLKTVVVPLRMVFTGFPQ